MNIEKRLERLEKALKTDSGKGYNTVVFVDECPAFDSCIVTIGGARHQGTKVEMNAFLEPYIKGGSVVVRGENELKD